MDGLKEGEEIVSGSYKTLRTLKEEARIKIEDEVIELQPWDAIRIGKDTMRNVEAGPDGAEYIAFGAGTDPRDAEMVPGWWDD